MIGLSPKSVLLVVCASVSLAVAADAPQLAWEDVGPASSSSASIQDLALDDQIVVAVGVGPAQFDFSWLVRAYDRRTGTLVWEDRRLDQRATVARSVAIAGGRAFVAGSTSQPSPGLNVLVVRAYDVRTGTMEWERALTPALSGDAFIVRAQAGHVFVGGRTSDGTSQQIAVLALHAGTGLTEWIHVSDGAGPGTGGVIFSLVASANDLFVAGDAGGSSHVDSSVFVRSLSRGEGAVLWETVIPFATTFFLTECLEAGSGLAFVCGSHHVTGATNDFMVRAYDARTGELRWADRPDDGGLWSSAAALTLSRGRLVVVGLSDCDFAAPTPGCRLAVRAYDAATGVLAWQDLASDHASVEDVVTDGELIFVAAGETVPTIRAYDAETGALVWVDRADGRIGAHLSLTVDDHWLFAGGFIRQNLSIISPYVRALSLKPVPAPR